MITDELKTEIANKIKDITVADLEEDMEKSFSPFRVVMKVVFSVYRDLDNIPVPLTSITFLRESIFSFEITP